MADLKATIGIEPAKNLKAKIQKAQKAQTSVVVAGPTRTLQDLTDVDMSLLEQGAMLVYDATAGAWKAKQTIADGTSFEGGHY